MNNNNEIWVFLSHSHEDYEKVRKVQSKPGDVTKSDSFRRKLLLSPTKEIKDALNALALPMLLQNAGRNKRRWIIYL